MGAILPIVTLLVVVTLGLLITRIATVALRFTGLSHDLARFQSRSAFTGVGFTTVESERLLDHPVRRKIIMILMLLGNAGIVTSASSLMLVFLSATEDSGGFVSKLLLLLSGLALLWAISMSKFIDHQMSRVIGWALTRWTHIEVRDYPALLRLSDGYSVSEVKVMPGDWVTGKSLIESRLSDEGIHVLGVRRADGEYLGAPTGRTYVRGNDTLLLYARTADLRDLENRRANEDGDRAHEHKVELQKTLITRQADRDTRDIEGEDAEEGYPGA